MRPSCLYAAEDEAREVTEQLIRDAGYEPVSAGGIENARALEDFVPVVFAQIGQVFYRFAPSRRAVVRPFIRRAGARSPRARQSRRRMANRRRLTHWANAHQLT